MKFSIKDFFNKYDQIRSFLQKSLMETSFFAQCRLKWSLMSSNLNKNFTSNAYPI